MSLSFKIHRGTKEIGGSCVEIWTQTTRIVIDFGLPLVNSNKTKFDSNVLNLSSIPELITLGVVPDIESLYNSSGEASILISHAHQDHYGLINYTHPNCKIYLGQATNKLITLTNLFTLHKCEIPNPYFFESGRPFQIGDIEITPFLMDHSAFDAYAFLVKSNGKTLFYSGDFRTHGRKSNLLESLKTKINSTVDYLLLEGTSVGRSTVIFKTEQAIEPEFEVVFKESKGINLVFTSGQNIDRIVSIYKACIKSGKTLLVDFYIANILKELSHFGKIPYPSYKYPAIRVFFPYRLSRMITLQCRQDLLYNFKEFKITREEINISAHNMVMIVRPNMQCDLEKLANLFNGNFIYSMWNGYKRDKAITDFIFYLKKRGVAEMEIHTSGHADVNGLKRLVEILNPKKIIPIHTFNSANYKDVFRNRDILELDDRRVISI